MAAGNGGPGSPGLLPHHLELLTKSAIAPAVARERGYRSATDPAELRALGFTATQARVPALLIPVHDVGGRVALHQARPDRPRIVNDKARKYETPFGKTVVVDVPPRVRPHLANPDLPLIATEGARKADAAASAGLCAVDFIGVDGFKTPCWEAINLEDRLVVVAYDSDVSSKSEVHDAMRRLTKFLRKRGAGAIEYVFLPAAAGEKVGLDDWLAAGGTPTELLSMATPELRSPRAAGRLRSVAFSAVTFEPVRFLVPGRVPLGALTLDVGDPGLGKSTWTIRIAAGVSRGVYGPSGVVAIVNAEDSAKAVTGPRLHAAGADLDRVRMLTVDVGDHERLLTLPDDVDQIEAFVVETGCRLLILDPLMAFLSERADANQDHSVRRALAALAAVAERHDLAVIVVLHLNKDEQKSLMYRVGGSIGLVGAARSILLWARDPDDPDGARGDLRLLAHAKSNWGKLAATARYEIEPFWFESQAGELIETSRLVDRGESDLTAEDLVGRRKPDGKLHDAAAAIEEELADGEPRLSREVKAAVREAVDCSLRTAERAAEELRAGGRLISAGQTSATTWQLAPSPSAKSLSEDGGGSANPAVEPNPPDSTPAAKDGEGNGGSRPGVLDADTRARLAAEFRGPES